MTQVLIENDVLQHLIDIKLIAHRLYTAYESLRTWDTDGDIEEYDKIAQTIRQAHKELEDYFTS